jgi:pyruvate kinase
LKALLFRTQTLKHRAFSSFKIFYFCSRWTVRVASICFNACRLSQRVEAAAILTMSFSGYTAYKIASQRPEAPIYVFTSNQQILTQLNLVWGVKAFYYDKQVSTDDTIADIKSMLKKMNLLEVGDIVINIASIPLKEMGGSNMLKLSYVD